MMKIDIVDLGYVGIPLAVALGRYYEVIGFDPDQKKIENYSMYSDPTGEVSTESFKLADKLSFTSDLEPLRGCNLYIVAVPTPVDEAKVPDLSPLESASRMVGEVIEEGAIVVYESTVYPGATEEICVPILEQASGLLWMSGFNVGYSPERVNPGDSEHTLSTIVKVVAGDTPRTLEKVASVYESVIEAGVYRAATIRVAEAAKVIENTQRDLNIALMNELAVIFGHLDIDTQDVLEAAGTKWNFLPFKPGLVGGHCIGVDPYYLTYKAQMINHHSEVILAGRRINDGMAKYVASETIKTMLHNGIEITGSVINLFGLTFKENCPDLRNSQSVPLIRELQGYGVTVNVCDPVADGEQAQSYYGINLIPLEAVKRADALVVAVSHETYRTRLLSEYGDFLRPNGCIIDVKGIFDRDLLSQSGTPLWRL